MAAGAEKGREQEEWGVSCTWWRTGREVDWEDTSGTHILTQSISLTAAIIHLGCYIPRT